jgi:hypothetical protein
MLTSTALSGPFTPVPFINGKTPRPKKARRRRCALAGPVGRFKRPWFQSYSGRVTFERFDRAAVAQHGAVRAVGDLVPTRSGFG